MKRMSSKNESGKAVKRSQRTKRNAQSPILLGGVPMRINVISLYQVKGVYEKRKENGTNCSYDFGYDGLVDVFGPDKGKRSLRGFSSSVYAKRAKQAFLTAALCDPTVNKCNSPVIGLKKVNPTLAIDDNNPVSFVFNVALSFLSLIYDFMLIVYYCITGHGTKISSDHPTN
ncbi:hypothetical protein MKW92_030353 [Papaver armeniacum]|nr:hypothetical protein MKW92_030353 [Papaver armeniacum]